MYRLILEHIIRRILSEEEYTSLGIGSFRGASHKNRTDKFVDYLKDKTPIPLKKGELSVVSKVEITKDKQTTSYDPITQSEELKDILPTLKSGDKFFLYDEKGIRHSISSVAKTPELGGKGKGHQRGSEAEAGEMYNVQKQIDANNTGNGITVMAGKNAYNSIVKIEKVEGNLRADFKLVNTEGNAVAFIQHKSPKHQQMSGISKPPISEFPEVKEFAQEVYNIVSRSSEKRLSKPYSKIITDAELKLLAVYGIQDGTANGVQFYCVGDITLNSLGDNKFTLGSNNGRIYTYGQIPEDMDAPTLVATYRAGRNQRVPNTKLVIPDTRLGIYPQNYISNS